MVRPGTSLFAVCQFTPDRETAAVCTGAVCWATTWLLVFGLVQPKSTINPSFSRYMVCASVPDFSGSRINSLVSRPRPLGEAIAKMLTTGPDFAGLNTTNTKWPEPC